MSRRPSRPLSRRLATNGGDGSRGRNEGIAAWAQHLPHRGMEGGRIVDMLGDELAHEEIEALAAEIDRRRRGDQRARPVSGRRLRELLGRGVHDEVA